MKAKLIKGDVSGEFMLNMKGVGYTTTYESIQPYKLSIKNCEFIERGCDLDELAEKKYFDGCDETERSAEIYRRIFKDGFQKALGLVGDKKFTKDDIKKAFRAGGAHTLGSHKEFTQTHLNEKEYVRSLEQKEWDVEIIMERVLDGYEIVNSNPKVKGSGGKIPKYETKPKLDTDGCLILKKI